MFEFCTTQRSILAINRWLITRFPPHYILKSKIVALKDHSEVKRFHGNRQKKGATCLIFLLCYKLWCHYVVFLVHSGGVKLVLSLAYGFVCFYQNINHRSNTLKHLALCHPVILMKCRSAIIAYAPTGCQVCLFYANLLTVEKQWIYHCA